MPTLDWREAEIDPGGVTFCLPFFDWVSLFHRIGFTIDDLREPRAPESVKGGDFFVTAEWARRVQTRSGPLGSARAQVSPEEATHRS